MGAFAWSAIFGKILRATSPPHALAVMTKWWRMNKRCKKTEWLDKIFTRDRISHSSAPPKYKHQPSETRIITHKYVYTNHSISDEYKWRWVGMHKLRSAPLMELGHVGVALSTQCQRKTMNNRSFDTVVGP